MALKFYNSSKVAIDNIGGSVVTSHNGRIGETVDVLLYIRNDESHIYYNNIVITPQDSNGASDILGVYGTGRGIKLSAGSRQPTEAEWDNVLAGDYVDMSNIGTSTTGDTTTYFPLWVRVIMPGNTDVQVFNDTNLKITASQHLVGA